MLFSIFAQCRLLATGLTVGLGLRLDCDDLPEPAHVDREMLEKIVLKLVKPADLPSLERALAAKPNG